MKKIRIVFAIREKDGGVSFWKTQKDALRGIKDEDYKKGCIYSTCSNLKEYVGLNIPRKKIIKIVFTGF